MATNEPVDERPAYNAVGAYLYDIVRAYFDDPEVAARFEAWKKQREATA